MTPDELRSTLELLKLSQRRTAAVLGVDERTIRRWIAGDTPVPRSRAKMLRLMVETGKMPASDD